MFPLHKAPSGLLALFNLKTLGANPTSFGQSVSPVIDVEAFYGAPELQWLAANAATAINFGDSATIQVPAIGFMWRLRAASCSLVVGPSIAAADGLGVAVQVVGNGPTGASSVTLGYASDPMTSTTGSVALTATWSGRPFVLLPGSQVSGVLFRTVGAAVTLQTRILVEQIAL